MKYLRSILINSRREFAYANAMKGPFPGGADKNAQVCAKNQTTPDWGIRGRHSHESGCAEGGRV